MVDGYLAGESGKWRKQELHKNTLYLEFNFS